MTSPSQPPDVELPNEQKRVRRQSLDADIMCIVAAHLAVSTVAGDGPLGYVIGSIALLCLWRATFLRGFPHARGGRALGRFTRALPAVGACAWVDFVKITDLAGTVG